MHPPTFCSLIRAYTFFYERDLRAHQDFLEEKRPDKKTRPANYKARFSAKEPQHGFLIVQHLHDRRSPWSLSPIILSHLYNKGISVSLSMMAWRSKRPRPKNSIGPSARALPSVATDITMSPSYLHLRHSAPVPSSTTFAAPLPGNSLRRARVQLVSLTVLICLISSSEAPRLCRQNV